MTPSPQGMPELSTVKKWAAAQNLTLQQALNQIRQAQKKMHQNPICEYCKHLHDFYTKSTSPKERRRAMARLRLHIKHLHRNPPDEKRLKMARVAYKLAYKLYKAGRVFGIPRQVIERIPPSIKPYVVDILEYNKVKIRP